MDDAFFHHEAQVIFRIGEEGDVVEWIAFDNQQVSDSAGRQDAEAAFHADKLCTDGGGGGENFLCGKDLGADRKFF